MRTVRSSRFLVFCALALALVVPPVHAQVAGGSISGSVLDSSGAVLPRAQVLIRNVETGVATEVVANDSGVYRAPNLRPGRYEVTASMPGFVTSARKGIQLTVGAALVLDLRLDPGGLQETVSVTTETPSVDTSTPSRSSRC